MPTILRKLRITRVDLVPKGANFDDDTGDGAHILLYKRAPDKRDADPPSRLRHPAVQALAAAVALALVTKAQRPQREEESTMGRNTDEARALRDDAGAATIHCPACDGDNPPGSAFCNQCGEKLTADKGRDVRERGDAVDEVRRKAAAIVAKDAKTTQADAIAKALHADPALYELYRRNSYAR